MEKIKKKKFGASFYNLHNTLISRVFLSPLIYLWKKPHEIQFHEIFYRLCVASNGT